ncbi:unnamed protein product, partial [Ixodes hexagonus]
LTLDEKSQSEPRLEPSASALSSQEQKGPEAEPTFVVEYGDSRRRSLSVNEGELGSIPPIGERTRKSLGSVDFGDPGPEKSEPLSAAPVSGDKVDIAKEFLEGIWGGSEESPSKTPIPLASLPEESREAIELKPLESISGADEESPLHSPSEPEQKQPREDTSPSKNEEEESASSSEEGSTSDSLTDGTSGTTTLTGETEEESDVSPGPPPPTQVSVKKSPSKATEKGPESGSASTEGSSTGSTSDSESTESSETGKEDQEAPLLPKDGAEAPKIGAPIPRTGEIKQAEQPALSQSKDLTEKPLSSSSTAKSSITKTSSGMSGPPLSPLGAQASSQAKMAHSEKTPSGSTSRGGNNPAYYAWANNEAHREAETRRRRIPCILLVLNIIVAFIIVLLYHVLLIRQLERRTKGSTEALLPSVEPSDDHVCRNVQCSAAGTQLFYVLNTSADPCKSIYDYVCESWMHLPPSSYRKVVLGAERLFVDSKYAEMDNALKMPEILSSPSIAVRKAALLYRDCLREAEKPSGGEENLRKLFESYDMGAWPFGETRFLEPYTSLAMFVRDTGVGALVSVKMVSDPSDPKTRTIALDCSTFVVPIGVLLSFAEHNATTLQGYKKYIAETISALHPRQGNVNHIAANIVEFEINLAHRCNRGCRKKKYKALTLGALTKEAGMGWEDFLAYVFTDGRFSRRSDTKILVRSLAYLKILSEAVLKNKAALRRAMNYIGWRIMHHFMRQAGMTYRSLTSTFMEKFIKAEPLPRWRSCLSEVNDVMPLAIGSVFVDHGLWRDNQFKASRIVASLLEVMAAMFQRWPEDGTRSAFSDLKNKMDFIISYPHWIKHPPTLDAYYDGVKADGDYFDRYVSASRVHYQNYLSSVNVTQQHRRLAEYIFPSRIVDLQLRSGPARENLFYDARDNTMILPAGALQPPYYDGGSPLGLVFGGLGTLVSRDLVNELFHTPEGILKEDQSKDVFKKKSQCLLDGMKKGLGSNASLDCSSVITDVFTVRVAFEAYHTFIQGDDDMTLQGVAQMTPDQLFFISAVRTLCTSIRERHFAQVVLLGKSVTEMQLIDSAVMQMREFEDAFECVKKDATTLRENLFNKCVYTSP